MGYNNQVFELYDYEAPNGAKPFQVWLVSIDESLRPRIRARLNRLRLGHWGDFKPVGNGVFELRFYFGSGYRIYFAQRGSDLIILLCGGDKSSQQKDIQQAQNYWHDYKRRNQ